MRMANKCAPILVAVLAASGLSAACSLVPPGGDANPAPTLNFRDVSGGPVAFESGQPVPTFDRQPRLQLDLDGTWRFDPQPVDTSLSLSSRKESLAAITGEVGGREDPQFDESSWTNLDVPGPFNM